MKKEERILNALTDVKEEYIEAVDLEEVVQEKRSRKGWKISSKWMGLAASVAILVLVSILIPEDLFFHEPKDTEQLVTETEKIDQEQLDQKWAKGPNGEDLLIITAACDLGTMGSGQVSEDEINTGPWDSSMKIETLPVYRNLAYFSPAGEPVYLEREQLLSMAEDVAGKLDTEIVTWEYYAIQDKPEKGSDVCQITATTESGEIEISGNGRIYLQFNEMVPWETQELLLESVSTDSKVEEMLEYYFNGVYFYREDEKGFSAMRYGDVRIAAEKLGEYPIVNVEDAKQRLMDGKYISILPESDVKGGALSDENIKSMDLVYLTGSVCQYYQPYYCFYIELEEEEWGFTQFYVPALEAKFLADYEELNPLGN